MIDLTRGTLAFEARDVEVGPRLREDVFLCSSWGTLVAPLVRTDAHASWQVRDVRLAGRQVAVTFHFRAGVLGQVHLCLVGDRFGGSWEDWSWEKELARQQEHARWLNEALGSVRRFPWGTVSSHCDAKTGGAAIVVSYGALALPQTKGDVEVAEALAGVPAEQLAPHVPELLAWLQDINWPVASPVAALLAKCGRALVEPIRGVLRSEDDVWKYWILRALLPRAGHAVRVALRAELERIASQPSDGERAEEVDVVAREIIATLTARP